MNRNSYICPDCNIRIHKEMRTFHQRNCSRRDNEILSSLRKRKQRPNLISDNNELDSINSYVSEEENRTIIDESNESSSNEESEMDSESSGTFQIHSFMIELLAGGENQLNESDYSDDPRLPFNDDSNIFIEIFQVENSSVQYGFEVDSQNENSGFLAFLMEFARGTVNKKRLSDELFNKLSVKKVIDIKELPYNVNKCMICIELFKKNECLTSLPCKHLYHKDCIKKWLDMNISCPICKVEINEENVKKSRKN